ncbi:hypothetical protein GWO43_01165, partial [candidate division KSB1 bacterium]|nr:hypothetical protein [candidate division KSB1 bacterium]NIR69215.1 hypothetical protein [candidate division KSB1 bacterium]NIS22674.1 hypothetical protein [candidate division KSB1 bacterium]NIT69530.1 hypothetical protein [candidate division KSB1 bacterium]NIU23185.1 hypothetical protein [candidate division KSB1 bacterium]
MRRLSKDAIAEIKQRMSGLTGNRAKQMARRLAEDFDVDITRIYHHSRDVRRRREI